MTPEIFLDGRVRLLCGDAIGGMNSLEENSVHSVVCDPPYHLHSIVKRFAKTGRTDKTRSNSGPHQRTARGFMNKTWDGGEVAFQPKTWEAALRILKPGAYLIAMSGTRTYHRMACAIEDAGFIVYDQLGWAYGQGFPKSVNMALEFETLLCERRGEEGWFYLEDGAPMRREPPYRHPEANQWHGYGTALKPAWEPICLARKPLDAATIRENVSKHGAGAININGCRITTDSEDDIFAKNPHTHGGFGHAGAQVYGNGKGSDYKPQAGRWPANIIHAASRKEPLGSSLFLDSIEGFKKTILLRSLASYVAGRENTDTIQTTTNLRELFGCVFHAIGENINSARAGSEASTERAPKRLWYSSKADADDRLGSKHPTVKPVDLMQWLVRLVTPKGGTTIDMFAGTGTTGEAAWREGMNCILIEREVEYQQDIRRRMALCNSGPEERRRESIKAKTKDLPQDHGPLFG